MSRTIKKVDMKKLAEHLDTDISSIKCFALASHGIFKEICCPNIDIMIILAVTGQFDINTLNYNKTPQDKTFVRKGDLIVFTGKSIEGGFKLDPHSVIQKSEFSKIRKPSILSQIPDKIRHIIR